MFSNPTIPLTSIQRSLQLAGLHGHRVLLVLAGVTDQYHNEICALVKQTVHKNQHKRNDVVAQIETQRPANIMHVPERHSNSDRSDQINALLGSETMCVFFDAYDAFDERLFAAAAGTIQAGGILVLRTPSLADWADKVDRSMSSRFINRVIKKIRQHQTAVLLEPAIANDQTSHDAAIVIATETPLSKLATGTNRQSWHIHQTAMVNRVLEQLQQPEPTTIVIQADRGRGKSALIGRALDTLSDLTRPTRTVTITANQQSACAILLEHANALAENHRIIQYLSVEEALQTQHDLLVVEEAGNISIPVLTRLTKLSNDIIFATTVQGYEGAGRGFALRFSKQLDRLRPGWQLIKPTQSIRWTDHDPLEAFVNDTLLLDTKLPLLTDLDKITTVNTSVRQINQNELSDNETLLEQIYSLLIQAHYQTTPADLRNMLDKKQLIVFAQYANRVLTGAALVAIEGKISAPIHESIVYKRRRVADQIIPQLLAQCNADPEPLRHGYARIVRIAIHPQLHRRGFGTAMFEQMSSQLARTVSNIGASFGADIPGLSFWLKQGFSPVHYGFKVNARSGLRSACLIAAADQSVALQVKKAGQLLRANLRAINHYSNEPDPIRSLLLDAIEKHDGVIDESLRVRMLSDFRNGNRGFIDSIGLIEENDGAELPEPVQQHFRSLLSLTDRLSPSLRRASEQAIGEFLEKNR